MPSYKPIEERFWPRVLKLTSGCWEWQGYRTPGGYGEIGLERSPGTIRTHRLSWQLHKGPIPPGQFVLHHCDNPPCVNPEHLFLGRHKENAQDAARKGRCHYAGLAVRWNYFRSRKRCPKGHLYSRRNTYANPSTGKRDCLTCKKSRKRLWDLTHRDHINKYRRDYYAKFGKC